MPTNIKKRDNGTVSSVLAANQILGFELSQQAVNEMLQVYCSYAPQNETDLNTKIIGRIVCFVGKASEIIPDLQTNVTALDTSSFFDQRGLEVLFDQNISDFGSKQFDFFSRLKSADKRGLSIIMTSALGEAGGVFGTVARMTIASESRSTSGKVFDVVLDNRF